jgi:Fe-S-cluster containining protein
LGKILDERLPPLYQAYDKYVATVLQTEDRHITCGSGCSACCHHYVSSVEPFEILAIHLRIRNSSRYSDLLFGCHNRTSKFEQIRHEEGEDVEADDRALYRYFLRGAACPFLGKGGTCGIYDIRPMSCRMFFSESSPRFCSGTALASPWNRNFQVELPDVAEEALARCSALLEGLELPEELFSGVLQANTLFGQYDS